MCIYEDMYICIYIYMYIYRGHFLGFRVSIEV